MIALLLLTGVDCGCSVSAQVRPSEHARRRGTSAVLRAIGESMLFLLSLHGTLFLFLFFSLAFAQWCWDGACCTQVRFLGQVCDH